MSTKISKICADFLRTSYSHTGVANLRTSHARELIAAFFGYKSHAALIANVDHHVDNLPDANYLVPDISMMDQRRSRLRNLSEGLPRSPELADKLCSFLQDEGYFSGYVYLSDFLEDYVVDEILVANGALVIDELCRVMGETSTSYFQDGGDYYESEMTSDNGTTVVITVKGIYDGTYDRKSLFRGDRIDMLVTVSLRRNAGRRGFVEFKISADGSVNSDELDPNQTFESNFIDK